MPVPAGIAGALGGPRRGVVEAELALIIEWVGDDVAGRGTDLVEIELAALTPVLEPDPGLLATIAVEGSLGVFEPELVPRVRRVRDFLHGGVTSNSGMSCFFVEKRKNGR